MGHSYSKPVPEGGTAAAVRRNSRVASGQRVKQELEGLGGSTVMELNSSLHKSASTSDLIGRRSEPMSGGRGHQPMSGGRGGQHEPISGKKRGFMAVAPIIKQTSREPSPGYPSVYGQGDLPPPRGSCKRCSQLSCSTGINESLPASSPTSRVTPKPADHSPKRSSPPNMNEEPPDSRPPSKESLPPPPLSSPVPGPSYPPPPALLSPLTGAATVLRGEEFNIPPTSAASAESPHSQAFSNFAWDAETRMKMLQMENTTGRYKSNSESAVAKLLGPSQVEPKQQLMTYSPQFPPSLSLIDESRLPKKKRRVDPALMAELDPTPQMPPPLPNTSRYGVTSSDDDMRRLDAEFAKLQVLQQQLEHKRWELHNLEHMVIVQQATINAMYSNMRASGANFAPNP